MIISNPFIILYFYVVMSKLRTGVIGVGYLGRFHAQKYSSIDGVELVGVADRNLMRSKSVAEECKCRSFHSYKELLKNVDAVSVVVPTCDHFGVARDCINAGVDVLLEKPMTVTVAEANNLVAGARENNLILQIGHLERFNPAVMAMKSYLTSPIFIESRRVSTFKKRGADVDVVLDLMIHDIDIILNIVDSPIKLIHGVGVAVVTDNSDIANVRLIFENGASANICASRIAAKSIRKMQIFQPDSTISIDFADKKIITAPLFNSPDNEEPNRNVKIQTFAESDALQAEIFAFTKHAIERTRPTVSGVEGQKALGVALEIIDQIKNNQDKPIFKDFQKLS